ncbi:chemotaxis protein CheW [Colwellia sp. MB3u-4]|uniref:chemotaxis protein CheW n=1 Tax=Colwellia sp. MB3u-4 TaxID=2759822 RepID=UPI002174DFC6|nr:chemotaxis protein CheW [Colwellia sp. MB3u-4]
MPKSLAASKKLMQTYLSELLTEEEVEQKPALPVKERQHQPLEKLLSSATFPKVFASNDIEKLSSTKADSQSSVQDATISQSDISNAGEQTISEKVAAKIALRQAVINPADLNEKLITTGKSTDGVVDTQQHSYRQGDFQVMFFEVAGLMIAVPLIELGGIHNTDKITPLMGKPDWFKGVMLHRAAKVNVVDTALWVMPEKCDEALISALNYQYIIMLNDSSWGLSAEKLVDTVTLKQEDVKWLDTQNKRPWLAGLVKNRMCVLLDVESLIKLLEKGVNISQE